MIAIRRAEGKGGRTVPARHKVRQAPLCSIVLYFFFPCFCWQVGNMPNWQQLRLFRPTSPTSFLLGHFCWPSYCCHCLLFAVGKDIGLSPFCRLAYYRALVLAANVIGICEWVKLQADFGFCLPTFCCDLLKNPILCDHFCHPPRSASVWNGVSFLLMTHLH